MDLHLPLSRVKLESMKQANWDVMDKQVVDVIRLKLTHNVAFNIVNMYDKPSMINKVYLMRYLFHKRWANVCWMLSISMNLM